MADDVRKRSKAVEVVGADWPLIDALLGGTRTMRAAGETYLPKFPAEDSAGYDARLKTATLFEAFKRTVDVLSAKPFSKPLALGDDVPVRIRGAKTETGWAEDIDLQGRNLHAFAGSLCREALSHGLSGLLVEYPQTASKVGRADGVMTQAEEQAAGIRPYFVQIHPQQLLGWKATRKDGNWLLTQLRFVEIITESDGEFSEKEIEQVRVLEPGSWRTYRKSAQANAQGDQWVLHENGTTTLNKIPFVPVYGERVGFMVGRPPLAGLAHLNQKHWSEQSDQDKAVHYSRVRLVGVIGVEEDKEIILGADYLIKLPVNGDIKVAQGSAEAVTVGQTHLEKIEDQMRQAGAELLVIKPGNTSVVQTLADNEPGRCALQRIAEDLEDALDQALQLMAEWVQEPSGGHVTLFKDFGSASFVEASDDLLDLQQGGIITKKTVITEKQRRGQLSPDIDPDVELKAVGNLTQ